MADVGGDDLGRDAAVEVVAQGVAESSAHGNVLGAEVARHIARQGGLLHRPVVDEARLHAPRAAFTGILLVGGAGRDRALHVGHHVQGQTAVAGIIDKGRIVEDERGVVVGNGDVVTAQGCHVSAHRQPQKIEGGLAVLSL